jgi:hypothetical protein
MSPSKKPRVVRSHKPKRKFTENTYRKAKPYLLQDFLGRCAYSLQHHKKIGWTVMETDHHDPQLKGAARNNYDNLFPASRHCNGSKSDHWPTKTMKIAGIRFLNPCKETDYGEQIFEDPVTHHLVGTTKAAIFHIRVLQLNAQHLVEERKERSVLEEVLDKTPALVKNQGLAIETVNALRQSKELMIPPIPAPPISAIGATSL